MVDPIDRSLRTSGGADHGPDPAAVGLEPLDEQRGIVRFFRNSPSQPTRDPGGIVTTP
jgi:hypothetical protein